MKRFSTAQAAKVLGMRQPHLQRAIAQGKVKAPPLTTVGGVRVRLWSPTQIKRARKALGRQARRK